MENNRQQYQLICTYFKSKYFISTIYRQASTTEEIWYFETMVWVWDAKLRKRGELLEMEESGFNEEMAMDNHLTIIKKLDTKSKQNNTI